MKISFKSYQEGVMNLSMWKMQYQIFNIHSLTKEESSEVLLHDESKCPMCRIDYYLSGGR